jgi:hypothetical protein
MGINCYLLRPNLCVAGEQDAESQLWRSTKTGSL